MEKVAFALFNDEKSSDVVIEVTDDDDKTEFYCHKFILSIASPVFESMFKHEGLNIVEITDFDAEAVETINVKPALKKGRANAPNSSVNRTTNLKLKRQVSTSFSNFCDRKKTKIKKTFQNFCILGVGCQ